MGSTKSNKVGKLKREAKRRERSSFRVGVAEEDVSHYQSAEGREGIRGSRDWFLQRKWQKARSEIPSLTFMLSGSVTSSAFFLLELHRLL